MVVEPTVGFWALLLALKKKVRVIPGKPQRSNGEAHLAALVLNGALILTSLLEALDVFNSLVFSH